MPAPLLRRIGVVLATLLVVGLAVALALSLYGERRLERARERFAAAHGSGGLDRFVLPEVPEPENAAGWLLAGAGAVVLSDDERQLLRELGRSDAAWSREDRQALARILESNRPARELLGRAVGLEQSTYSIDYRGGPEVELPPLLELLGAGRLIWFDARLAVLEADGPRLRADLRILDRLVRSLERESLLVTVLVSQALDRLYLDLVHQLVTGGTDDRDLLAEIGALLAGRDRLATYRRGLAADGWLVASLSAEQLMSAEGRAVPLWARLPPSRAVARLLMASLIDEYSAIGELTGRPYPEIRSASEARLAQGLPRGFAVTLLPSLIDSMAKLKAAQSAARLAAAAITGRRALWTEGAYPAAGMEPWVDPFTGRRVAIELRPDGSLTLEAPGALDLWRQANPNWRTSREPPFSWRLPPAEELSGGGAWPAFRADTP